MGEDPYWQDHHFGRRGFGHDRQREGEDPGQGGHSAGPAAAHLRRQAARGWPDPFGLQHPEGVHASLGLAAAWWDLTGLLSLPVDVYSEARVPPGYLAGSSRVA